MGNVSFNPLSALSRETIAGICRYEPSRRLVETMVHETLAVARAVGAEPHVSVERRLAGGEKVGEH